MKKAKGLAKVALAATAVVSIAALAGADDWPLKGLKDQVDAAYQEAKNAEEEAARSKMPESRNRPSDYNQYNFNGPLGGEQVSFFRQDRYEEYVVDTKWVCDEYYHFQLPENFVHNTIDDSNCRNENETGYYYLKENFLEVIRADGKKVVYMDKDGNDLKLESVYVEQGGEGKTYRIDNDFEAPVIAEAQKQFDEYLERIVAYKINSGLEDIRK